jgi:hypothetical protein
MISFGKVFIKKLSDLIVGFMVKGLLFGNSPDLSEATRVMVFFI